MLRTALRAWDAVVNQSPCLYPHSRVEETEAYKLKCWPQVPLKPTGLQSHPGWLPSLCCESSPLLSKSPLWGTCGALSVKRLTRSELGS